MKYFLELEQEDMIILDKALIELPFKISAGLINKINLQISEQEKNLKND